MAWSGLLGNFAAGVFLMVLRPFKVGDAVTAAGVTGTVTEIGLFSSSIDTADNIRTYVGNSRIFGDTIQNFTTNPHRRVDIRVQLAHSVVIRTRRWGQAPGAPPQDPQRDEAPRPPRGSCSSSTPWDPSSPFAPTATTITTGMSHFATNEAIPGRVHQGRSYPVAEQHFVVRKPASTRPIR